MVCYVIGVNRIGDDGNGVAHNGGTAVYDFKGDTLAKAADDKADILISTIDKEPLELFKQSFPAHLDADGFSLHL